MKEPLSIEDDCSRFETMPLRSVLAKAERTLAPQRQAVFGAAELLASGDADWIQSPTRSANTALSVGGLTMRRRGAAQSFPWPQRLQGGTRGTLSLYPRGLVLEPREARQPCVHIPATEVIGAEFYRDVLVLRLDGDLEAIVRTALVDAVDSIMGACFWTARDPGARRLATK